MRLWPWVLIGLPLGACPLVARADDDGSGPGLALATGEAIDVAAFIVGGTLLARGHGAHFTDNAGWITIESGFVLSPLAAHGVSDEWGRGVLFAVLPLATLAVTVGLFEGRPDTVEHGTLAQQRWMWAMFATGLFASTAGVVDALWAPARVRSLSIQPMVGWGRGAGVQIGGVL